MRVHSGEKSFKCMQCEYTCSWKVNLKEHTRVHTGEKPYKCTLCSYSCSQNGNLKKHMVVHTGEKPFKCKLCSYSCAQKHTLNEHESMHRGIKPFQCELCSYSCTFRNHLKTHMLIHTGETFSNAMSVHIRSGKEVPWRQTYWSTWEKYFSNVNCVNRSDTTATQTYPANRTNWGSTGSAWGTTALRTWEKSSKNHFFKKLPLSLTQIYKLPLRWTQRHNLLLRWAQRYKLPLRWTQW